MRSSVGGFAPSKGSIPAVSNIIEVFLNFFSGRFLDVASPRVPGGLNVFSIRMESAPSVHRSP